MNKKNYTLYKKIVMGASFAILSISIVFLMFSLSTITHTLNQFKTEFNDEFALIYQPTDEIVSYAVKNFNDDYSIYSQVYLEINGASSLVYSVVTNHSVDVIGHFDRFRRFTPKESVPYDTIYQSQPLIDKVPVMTFSNIQFTIEGNQETSFLFTRQPIEAVVEDSVYLIKINTDSKSYSNFKTVFGEPTTSLSLVDGRYYHVLGGAIFEEVTSTVMTLLVFLFLMYLIPALLYVTLFTQSYRILLSESLIYFKIKHIFYQSKKSICLNEYKDNVIIFSFVFIFISLLFSLIFNLHTETLLYLIISFGIILILMLFATWKVVSYAIDEKTTYEGDLL